MLNRKLKDKVRVLEVVVDALIGVLTSKKVMTRDEIQKQIIDTAARDATETAEK